MHWMGEGDPPKLTDKGKETVIYDDWEIPIAVGGAKGEIAGTLTWVPLDSGGLPLGAIFGFAGAASSSLSSRSSSCAAAAARRRTGAAAPRRPSKRGETGGRPLLALARGARGAGVGVRPRDAAVDHPGARRRSSTRRPTEVVFVFDEAVEASFGALRVFDATGQRGPDRRAPTTRSNRGEQIAVKLKPGLGDGTYTATYRLVSADGHADLERLRLHRRRGRRADRVARPAARLRRRRRPGHEHRARRSPAPSSTRAIALGLGALIFFLVCWRPARVVSRPVHRPPGAHPADRRDRRLRVRAASP